MIPKATVKECFEVGKEYTVFKLNAMAMTVKQEIKVVGFDAEGNPIWKEPRGRKEFVLRLATRSYRTAPLKEFDGAIFEGWDQPIKADTDRDRPSEMRGPVCCRSVMRGNACYNFMAEPLEVRAWVETGQLNPKFEKFKVVACGRGNDREEVVYPELYKGGHAVIERLLQNGKEGKCDIPKE